MDMPRDDPVTTATIIFVHAGHYRGPRGQFWLLPGPWANRGGSSVFVIEQ